MNEFKGSTGLWHVGSGQSSESNLGIYDENSVCVALAWRGQNPVYTNEQVRANAHILAASKEMFEALQKLKSTIIRDVPDCYSQPCVDESAAECDAIIDDALAKALGQHSQKEKP